MGIENPDPKKVQEAAKIANAHEFISQFENGYEHNIGDGGHKLSGGQKQRISIARAVMKKSFYSNSRRSHLLPWIVNQKAWFKKHWGN